MSNQRHTKTQQVDPPGGKCDDDKFNVNMMLDKDAQTSKSFANFKHLNSHNKLV